LSGVWGFSFFEMQASGTSTVHSWFWVDADVLDWSEGAWPVGVLVNTFQDHPRVYVNGELKPAGVNHWYVKKEVDAPPCRVRICVP
jgi:hypothetical protein